MNYELDFKRYLGWRRVLKGLIPTKWKHSKNASALTWSGLLDAKRHVEYALWYVVSDVLVIWQDSTCVSESVLVMSLVRLEFKYPLCHLKAIVEYFMRMYVPHDI
jgi:hypothetical protein